MLSVCGKVSVFDKAQIIYQTNNVSFLWTFIILYTDIILFFLLHLIEPKLKEKI